MKNTINNLYTKDASSFGVSLSFMLKASEYKIYCQMADVDPVTGANVTESASVSTGGKVLGTVIKDITDAVVKEVTVTDMYSMDNTMLMGSQDNSNQDIKLYLGKPFPVVTGLLAATDTSATFPERDVFASVFVNPVTKDKLSGVFAWKATTVVTLQVNATRFQAGRYILAFLPNGGATHDVQSAEWNRMKRASKEQVTQLPHVELDLATDTEVILRIPYVSWMHSCPTPNASFTSSTVGSPGWFFLYPYYPLIPGSGSTTCDYTIWVHYEDVELFSNATAQMADVTAQEQASNGPISGGIRVIQRHIGFAKVKIDAVVKGINWVLDATAGAASLLGWSKPANLNDADERSLRIHPAYPNADGKDNSSILALSQRNYVDPAVGFAGSQFDEMTIDYIKSIPSYSGTFLFTAALNAGDTILTERVEPSAYSTIYLDGAANMLCCTPIGFLGQMFCYYRGGIKYKFKFVKTEFHSGRLLVTFSPVDTNKAASLTPPTLAQAAYLQKTIIDLRHCSEFEVTVPYVSNTSWKTTNRAYGGGAPTDGEPYAIINLQVLSPLVNPDTVSSTVPIIVEVSGAKDLEFAVPKQWQMSAYVPNTIQMGYIEAQSGEITTGVVNVNIGNTFEHNLTIKDAAMCIGEVTTSLRQLLKRPTFLTHSTVATAYNISVYPYYSSKTIGTATVPTKFGTIDNYTIFTAMYALKRGSVRLKFIPDVPSQDSAMITSLRGLTPFDTITFPYGASTLFPGLIPLPYLATNNCQTSVQKVEWGVSIAVPYYNITVSQPSCSHLLNNTNGVLPGRFGCSPVSVFSTYMGPNTTSATTTILRYGGDDVNFGMFCGVPPLYASASVPT